MSAAIVLKDVSKRFGRVHALRNVTMEVPSGSVFALLGENGAGKTTTIKVLLGLERAEQGEATVLGRDCWKAAVELRREMGVVPDQPAVYDWMTVGEMGWFMSGFYSDGYLDRFRGLAAEFGLSLERKIRTLSRGDVAKVGLATALSHEPKLLILDEPTSGLDPLVRKSFLSSMADRAAEGSTVLLSSHQIHDVERVADYVGFLRKGEIVFVESLETLRRELVEVVVRLRNAELAREELPLDVLGSVRDQNHMKYLVRTASIEALSALDGLDWIESWKVREVGLEDAFVAIAQGGESTVSV